MWTINARIVTPLGSNPLGSLVDVAQLPGRALLWEVVFATEKRADRLGPLSREGLLDVEFPLWEPKA